MGDLFEQFVITETAGAGFGTWWLGAGGRRVGNLISKAWKQADPERNQASWAKPLRCVGRKCVTALRTDLDL